MERIKNFKDLRIWQKGIEIVKRVYSLTRGFPKEEVYGLTAQMRRAAVSIPSNIAEGFKRYHRKEFKQFLHITLGSTAELETQVYIARELNFIDEERLNDITDMLIHQSKMISSLVNKLK